MAKYPIILGQVTYDAGKPVDRILFQQSTHFSDALHNGAHNASIRLTKFSKRCCKISKVSFSIITTSIGVFTCFAANVKLIIVPF